MAGRPSWPWITVSTTTSTKSPWRPDLGVTDSTRVSRRTGSPTTRTPSNRTDPPANIRRGLPTSGRNPPTAAWPSGPVALLPGHAARAAQCHSGGRTSPRRGVGRDRKSTRLNSSHLGISYAVFCLKKKKHGDVVQHGKKRLLSRHLVDTE